MRRLIVSFIGKNDLKHIDPPAGSRDLSPILRLLLHLGGKGGLAPERTTLRLFDDRPEDAQRSEFCARLAARLPEIGLEGMRIEREAISIAGPTDLDGLYTSVWNVLPRSEEKVIDEYVCHMSSGTWAMQATLALAASCLLRPPVRLFETSWEQGVVEIELPYLLGLRQRMMRERQAPRQRLRDTARKTLLADTVLAEPLVEMAYAALERASRRKPAARVLIKGPTGSGKWHAARQFALWRGGRALECGHPEVLSTLVVEAGQTVLVRWLDGWNRKALTDLARWCDRHREVAVAATWRTDIPPAADLLTVAREGLREAALVDLPSVGSRSDVVALAEALARQRGIWDGKLSGRFQHDLMTDVYARNLHDLAMLLATMADHSATAHPDRDGYQRAAQSLRADEARAELHAEFDALIGLHFGLGQPTLGERLEAIKRAVVRSASVGRTQQEVEKLLGYSQQTVSKLLNKSPRKPAAQIPGSTDLS
jgi:hypothetical protein